MTGETTATNQTTPDDLEQQVADMMQTHWVDLTGDGDGYAAPNSEVYPWQWLWDSCFHVLVWARLGDHKRAVAELSQVFVAQTADGFVPHMNYQLDPSQSVEFWGRAGSSSITQPPMFGHAAAELLRNGVDVPGDVVANCLAGLSFLLTERRRTDDGLVVLCHPWETGTDDSPRWDDACPGGFAIDRWRAHKSYLVGTVEHNDVGSAVANPEFEVASAGFNALIAFNTFELASTIAGDGPHAETLERLRAAAEELVGAIDARWNGETWIDGGKDSPQSGGARTADGLLPLLVTANAEARVTAFASLVDPSAYGGPFGPAGVHRAEPTYEPNTYWRGPAWPQLSYLLWIAARNANDPVATQLGQSLRAGSSTSGLAEYWNIDSGNGLGAMPQSWAGLGILV